MNVWTKLVPIHSVAVEIFSLDRWIRWPAGCIWNQGISKVVRIHPLETMNACTTSHGNPSNSCRDILVEPFTDRLTDRSVNIMTKHFWNHDILPPIQNESQDQDHWSCTATVHCDQNKLNALTENSRRKRRKRESKISCASWKRVSLHRTHACIFFWLPFVKHLRWDVFRFISGIF